MPVADHGGFDLTVEIAANALSAVVSSSLNPPLPQRNIPGPPFSGTVTPQALITGATLSPSNDITVSMSISGTVLHVTKLFFALPGVGNPPDPWLSDIAIGGVVLVTDRLELVGNALVVDFRLTPILNQPDVQVQLDESVTLASPLVQFALAAAFLTGGQTGYEQARSQLLQSIQTQVQTSVRTAVLALGVMTLVPAPAGLPLGVVVTASALLTSASSLHVFYALGNPPGVPGLVTRSMLLTSSLTGLPVDAAALALSNAAILGVFLRRGAVAALGLPGAGFLPGHPFLFVGPAPIAIPGGPILGITGVVVNTLMAGIDEAGLLHISVGLTATGVAGAFSVTATVDAPFAVAAAITPGALSITVAPAGLPSVASDVSIAWWVYVAGALTGGLNLVGILAAIDAFAGSLLNGPIAGAIGGLLPTITVPIPMPGRIPPLAIRTFRGTQPDSGRRTLPFPPPVPPLPDPFRSHDWIINLV